MEVSLLGNEANGLVGGKRAARRRFKKSELEAATQSNQPEVGGHDGPHREGPLLGPGAGHGVSDDQHLVEAQEDPENVTHLVDDESN